MMFAGFRLWLSVLFMCLGSAMLSWRQTIFISIYTNNFHGPTDDSPSFFNGAEDDDDGVDRQSTSFQQTNNNDVEKDDASLFKFREPADGSIKSISLLGERNSGTRWIYGHLGLCFNHTIPVHRSLSRYKHWFQYDDAKEIPKNTLSIAMFRDPIAWTYAMQKVPHHASMHLDLPWKEFVTQEWNMERLEKDVMFFEDQKKLNNHTGRICQCNFHYHEIVSCLLRPYPDGYWGMKIDSKTKTWEPHRKHRFSQHQPFYEMRVNDPKGRPYNNILEMRADKIRNFMESSTYANVDGFWHYQYEGLLKTGTRELVEKIERATGLKHHPEKCKIYDPQNRRKREMPLEYVDYMINHVDWDAEALIGYKKDNPDYRAEETTVQ